MTDKYEIIAIAIITIGILELVALLKGLDGALFASVLTIIGGLAGYGVKAVQNKITK